MGTQVLDLSHPPWSAKAPLVTRAGKAVAPCDASGFDDVGELEYHVGDGQNDVDLLVRRARIALEVDAAVDRLVGWDSDCLEMRGRCRKVDCFLSCSLSGRLEFANLWIL